MAVIPGTTATSKVRLARRGPLIPMELAGHGKHTGITTRDEHDARALRRMAQGGGRARGFFAVRGGIAHLARSGRNAIEVGPIPVQRAGLCEGSARLGREPARISRAKTDDGKTAPLTPVPPSRAPGPSKDGASSSILAVSRIEAAFAVVPRST